MKRTPLLLMALAMTACLQSTNSGSDATIAEIAAVQGRNGFTGQVAELDAFLALVVGDTVAFAYLCNGERKVSEWFRSSIERPADFTLENQTGGKLTATFTGSRYEGDITLPSGKAYAFTVVADTSSESMGMYRVMGDDAEGDKVEAGWVVDADGNGRGSLRLSGTFKTTTALPTQKLVVGAKSYTVFRIQMPDSRPSPGPFTPIPYPNISRITSQTVAQ